VLGDDALAETLCTVYGVSEEGNFEHGMSILNLPRTIAERAEDLGRTEETLLAELATAKSELLAHRYTRVPPLRDEKVLTSWVALLVSGLARAASAAALLGKTGEVDELVTLATVAAQRLVDAHVDEQGRVLRAEFEGKAHTMGVLDDVAFLARACLDLHELTLLPVWRQRARTLAQQAIDRFARPDCGGFFFTAVDAEALIERTESQIDGPIPSGLAVMVEVLARLDASDDAPDEARTIVEKTLHRYHGAMSEPFAYASLLSAAGHVDETARHVKVRGPAPDDPRAVALAAEARRHRLNTRACVGLSFHPGDVADAIVCRGQVCTAPLREPAEVAAALRDDATR